MVIHETLTLLTTTYPNKPTNIFTDCVHVLYLLNTQIQHPFTHNYHLDKSIVEEMVQMLQLRTQITNLYKVRAHVNIKENEIGDELAKKGREKDHRRARHTHMNMYIHCHITSIEKIGHP